MAMVMMLPGDGHDYHRKIHLSRQMWLRVGVGAQVVEGTSQIPWDGHV